MCVFTKKTPFWTFGLIIPRRNDNQTDWHGDCFYWAHMFERMGNEIKKPYQNAAPALSGAGAAEKNFFNYLDFLLDKPHADLL